MKPHQQILGSVKPEQAERMLVDLANVPDLPPVGTVIVAGEADKHTAWVEKMKERYRQIFGKCSVADMFALRHLLRAAWDDPNPRRGEWFCFLFRKLHAESERLADSLAEDAGAKLIRDAQVEKEKLEFSLKPGGRRPVAEMVYNLADGDLVAACKDASPPALDDFEHAAFHLQRNLNRALHCPNPTCTSPYFFRTTKGQKYCGMPGCTSYGQRESKRLWWQKNRATPKSKRKSKRRG